MGTIRTQERGVGLAGQTPVRRITTLAFNQPQIFQAGQFCAANFKQVVMVHNVNAHRMLDAAAARSLLRWNSV